MVQVKTWTDLSMNFIYHYNACVSAEERLNMISQELKLRKGDEPQKEAILLDFYYYILKFAEDQKFSSEKTSAFFSIMKATHEHCVASPVVNLAKDHSFFKDLLLQHCVQRPPYSERVFDPPEMISISEFAADTYFRHYALYKYVFTKQPKLHLYTETKIPEQPLTEIPDKDVVDGSSSQDEVLSVSHSDTKEVTGVDNQTCHEPLPVVNASVSSLSVSVVNPSLPPLPEQQTITSASHAVLPAISPLHQMHLQGNGATSSQVLHTPAAPPSSSLQNVKTIISDALHSQIEELTKTLTDRLRIQEEALMPRIAKLEEQLAVATNAKQAESGKKKKINGKE